MLKRAISSTQYYKVHLRIFSWARYALPPRTALCIPTCSYATFDAVLPRLLPGTMKGPETRLMLVDPIKPETRQILVDPVADTRALENILTMLRSDVNLEVVLDSIRSSPTFSDFFGNKARVTMLGERVTQNPSGIVIQRYLHILQELGFRLKYSTYEALCHKLALQREWNLVLEVAEATKHYFGRCSSRILNWRVRALVELREHRILGGIIDEFKQQGRIPSRRTYHLLISAHFQNHNLSAARLSLLDMEKAGIPVDASTHALIAKYHRPFGADPHMLKQVVQAFPRLPSSDATSTVNSLIRICMDKNDMSGVARLLSFFDQSSVKTISEICFGSSVLSSKHITLYPDARTFALFIAHQAAAANLPGALRIFHDMITQGIGPNTAVLSALVQVYCACGHFQQAARLVYRICDPATPGFPGNTTPSPVEDIHIDVSNIRPTTYLLHSLLKGMLPHYGFAGIKWTLDVMRLNNVSPNHATLDILLRYLRKENVSSREILRAFRRLTSAFLPPTARHVHLIIACFMRHQMYLMHGCDWKSAPSTGKTISDEDLLGLSQSFDPFAGLLPPKHLSYRSLAKPIYNFLTERMFRSDPVLMALRIRQHAVVEQNVAAAKEIFRLMLKRGIRPNEYHLSALMEGYAVAGDIPSVIDTMKSAERLGIRPNSVMFTILISAYARQRNPEDAIRSFKQMVQLGIVPDVPSIDATCNALYATGKVSLARNLLLELWSYIEPFPEELRNASLLNLVRRFRGLHRPITYKKKGKDERLIMRNDLTEILKKWKKIARGTTRE